MRTRSKIVSGGVVLGAPCEFWSNGSFQNYETVSSPDVFKGTTSTIVDQPSGRGWKPVSHYTVVEDVNTDTSCRWTASPQAATHKGPNAYWSVWCRSGPHYTALTSYTPIWPRTITQQKAAAYAKFLSNNEVNTLLNAWEAPQLGESLSSLAKTFSLPSVKAALRKVVKAPPGPADLALLSRLRPSRLAESAKKAGSVVANNYLAYSFGIAPLLSDMNKVERASSTFVKNMRSAVKRAGEESVVRDIAVCNSSHSDFNSVADHRIYGDAGYERVFSVKGVNSIPFHATKLREIDYIMKRWGSPGPASLAWERIPFSFVVDWFLDTSVLMASLDNALTGGTKKVTGMMATTVGTYRSEMKHHSPSYPDSEVPDGTVVASQVARFYDREIHSVLPPMVAWKGRFGKKQELLTAALLYQQVANRY